MLMTRRNANIPPGSTGNDSQASGLPILVAGLLILTGLVFIQSVFAQNSGDAFEQGFANPPDEARPRTWWHWTGSNITREGITSDLEWMKRVGIGGMQLADVNFGMGQTVEEKIVFGTPAWLEAVRHAAAEADRLGLEMALFSSAGWSLTGGPWVKPEQAMKKLVWSESIVEGPRTFSEKLPRPPSNNGPIRNLSTGGGSNPPDPTYYGDSAVIAFLTPQDERSMADQQPVVTTNAGPVDATPLLDDDLNTALTVVSPPDGDTAWVQFAFARPYQARAITIGGTQGIPVGRVLASQDGTHYQTLVTLPGAQLYRQGRVRTFAFPATTARFYRIEMTGAPLGPAETMNQAPAQPDNAYVLTEALLHAGGRVHRWEEKAGFSFLFEYESVPTPEVPGTASIPSDNVVDLTSKMDADGTLHWEIPPGRWTILRMGYSLTGAKNRPAVPAGLGFEVDKLSARHTRDYFRNYTEPITEALGPLYGKSLRYMLLDSWEAGMQNWTEEMLHEFRTRRGYDPTPYLPVLTGRIVESADVSDRFLWDFRRTLVDMFAENHYGVATEFLNSQGLGTYSEAAGVSLEVIEDALLNKKHVDIPMGEFWVQDLHPSSMYYVDVRGAASAAHVYGKPIAAAEAYTGGGYESPYTLKRIGDYWFAQGINRFVFHTSAHQPLDTMPGNTMVGTHLNRNITWAEQAKPFMTYLTRNAYMLQQGLFVADLAYLLNEGAPSTMPFWGAGLQPAPPEGYDYDYVNTDVLLNRMSVDADGRLVLPDGMSYHVLVLPETDRMTVSVLQKIRDLVRSGATVVGPKPTRSPGLMQYPYADSSVRAIAEEVWGDLDGISRTTRVYGKGRVVWGLLLTDILQMLGLPPDVEYSRELDAELVWIHRRTDEADIYFVANQTGRAREVDVRFRVSGREAERWQPDTGAIEPAAYRIEDGRTTVPLELAAHEAVFVVFRHTTSSAVRTLPRPTKTTLAALSGPWQLTFPPGLGAPSEIQLRELSSWTEHADDGVKYFSGTATYTKEIQASQDWFAPGTKLLLDLGTVKDLAEVSINGEALGIVWKPPFRVDVTDVLKPGTNLLEIAVTNQWTNRLLGDQAADPGQKVLATSTRMIGRIGTPPVLAESGLLGPVQILSETITN